MQTLTYSNTFKGPLTTDPEQTVTNEILVNSKTKGEEVVAQWNANSKRHCKGMYHYKVVSILPATLKEMDTLHLY